MCRFFAVRSQAPVALDGSLCTLATSLCAQSKRDLRGECHEQGWGIATYDGERPKIFKSLQRAHTDPGFTKLATGLISRCAIAHVRQASVGKVALENTHPFAYGRWVFAHNGTLQDFAARKAKLLQAIPADLREQVRGATDSEHVFFYWLGQLRGIVGDLEAPASVDAVCSALRATVQQLAAWFPSLGNEPTRLNFLLTDGQLLAATRWKHSLWRLERAGAAPREGGPQAAAGGGRCVLIASEPTTDDVWQEVPDRSLLVVDAAGRIHAEGLDSTR